MNERTDDQASGYGDENWISPRFRLKLWLISANKPEVMARLEAELGMTQAQVVDSLIEYTELSDDLPELIGWRGTPQERLGALRKLLRSYPDARDIVGTGHAS